MGAKNRGKADKCFVFTRMASREEEDRDSTVAESGCQRKRDARTGLWRNFPIRLRRRKRSRSMTYLSDSSRPPTLSIGSIRKTVPGCGRRFGPHGSKFRASSPALLTPIGCPFSLMYSQNPNARTAEGSASSEPGTADHRCHRVRAAL